MSTNYPGNIDSYTDKVNNQDTIIAAHVNNLQDAIVAIETELGTNPSGEHDTVKEYIESVEDSVNELIEEFTLPIGDTDISLSAGNMGCHSTLAEHVCDSSIHRTVSSSSLTPRNFPEDIDTTLDQLFRGVLSTGNGMVTVPSSDASLKLNTGDIIYCFPESNPSTSGYGWHIITMEGTGPSHENLRIDNETGQPSFASGSQVSRIVPDKTADVENGSLLLSAGDLAFCYATANPTGSEYDWRIVTTGATGVSSSALRLNGETTAPVFLSGSYLSVVSPGYTMAYDDSSNALTQGDLLFCITESYPSSSQYDWHIVTTGGIGADDDDLRLDDESSAPVFSTNSRISGLRPGSTALVDNTSLCLTKGDIAFCHTTENPSGSGYGWHILTASSTGVSSSSIRLDGEGSAPVYSGSSRFSDIFPGYQGVAQGGEILEIAYVPDYFFVTTAGVGTGGSGSSNPVYGNITPKLPLPACKTDEEFTKEEINFTGIGNPPYSTAYRPKINYIACHENAYKPEVGMIVKLNSEDAAARGRQGAGITNRQSFTGALTCEDNPICRVFGMGLSSSIDWIAGLPIIARVCDPGDNSQITYDEYVMLLATTTTDSPGSFPEISTEDADTNSIDIFKLPSYDPYFGTGSDGELIIDGIVASNSTNGIAWPGGELSYPLNICTELQNISSGGLTEATYSYRVVTVDQYDNESDASDAVSQEITSGETPADIKITWDAVIGAKAYRIYGRSTGSTQYFMAEVTDTEYIDDNTDTPDTGKSQPTENNTDGCYRIDTVKHYTNVTLQNGGHISATPWDGSTYGKLVIYATDTFTIDSGCSIDLSGKGYRGGAVGGGTGYQGESYTGEGIQSTSNNAGGGGGGYHYYDIFGGAGGGHATAGENSDFGIGGTAYGTPDLAILHPGSGGGGCSDIYSGHAGGGIIKVSAQTMNVYGTINADGKPETDKDEEVNQGGAGAGGSIYLTAINMNIGSKKVTAVGGKGAENYKGSGDGANGRIRLDFRNIVGSADPDAYRKYI